MISGDLAVEYGADLCAIQYLLCCDLQGQAKHQAEGRQPAYAADALRLSQRESRACFHGMMTALMFIVF